MTMNSMSNKSGFTLVEIILTILVLVILVVGTAAMMSRAGVNIARQANSRIVMDLVNDQLEAAVGGDFDAIVDWAGTVVRDGNSYAVTTTVTELSTPSSRKVVHVEVAYNRQIIEGETVVIYGLGILR